MNAPTIFQEQAHYRKIFVKHNGDGPWACFFCGDEVSRVEKDTRFRLAIHHKNHNHDDDRKLNLKPAHNSCHSRHHSIGRKHTPETRAKQRAASMGNQHGLNPSDETREKLRVASTGRLGPNRGKIPWNKGAVTPDEVRAKISEAHKGKILSPETRAKISKIHRGKPKSPETRARMSDAAKRRKVSL